MNSTFPFLPFYQSLLPHIFSSQNKGFRFHLLLQVYGCSTSIGKYVSFSSPFLYQRFVTFASALFNGVMSKGRDIPCSKVYISGIITMVVVWIVINPPFTKYERCRGCIWIQFPFKICLYTDKSQEVTSQSMPRLLQTNSDSFILCISN